MFSKIYKQSIFKTFFLGLLIVMGYSITILTQPMTLESAPTATTPEVMVKHSAHSYDLVDSKLLWHTDYYCKNDPNFPGLAEYWHVPVMVKRVGTLGSLERTLFIQDEDRPTGECNPYNIYSNIVSDGEYVYWVDDTGLVKLSIDSDESETALTINTFVKSEGNDKKVELAIGESKIYAITYQANGSSRVRQVPKGVCGQFCIGAITINRPGMAHDLSHDGKYLYWIENGALHRLIPGQAISTIVPSGVTGYFAEGSKINCVGQFCVIKDIVFVGQGATLRPYNNQTNVLGAAIYSAIDPKTFIYTITAVNNQLLFFEARPVETETFIFYNQVLMRTDRDGATEAECTYSTMGNSPITLDADHLKAESGFVFWREDTAVLRLPADIEACQPINISLTEMMVTQAIQNDKNEVPLVEGKRTYVRVLAETDGETADGVTAHLYRINPLNNQIMAGPLIPINKTGPYQTIKDEPREKLTDGDFLFVVPRDWVKDPVNHSFDHGLSLKVVVNPYSVPFETDYSDNSQTVEMDVVRSPRLGMRMVAFEYENADDTIAPSFVNDVLATYDSIKRIYPLDSNPTAPKNLLNPTYGLQVSYVTVELPGLKERVNLEHSSCANYADESDEGGFDWRYLCGIDYANAHLTYLRDWNNAPDDTVYYGLIKSQIFSGGGSATGVSSRVASSYTETGDFKDTAVHEIGHAFGLQHPGTDLKDDPKTTENESCGHSASDPNYPYGSAQIGPIGKMWGFDSGNFETSLGKGRKIYQAEDTYSLMSYCDNRWISDYNYMKMWVNLTLAGNSSRAAELVPIKMIGVYGSIAPEAESAMIDMVVIGENKLLQEEVKSKFGLRLVDKSNSPLATHGLTVDGFEGGGDHGPTSLFGQVVPFIEGTTAVQIVDFESDKIWATYAISSQPPEISDLTIDNLNSDNVDPDHVKVYELSWDASDPDGDPLTFNLFYSNDGGETFDPLKLGLTALTAEVSSRGLPGGKGVFKVVVSDGAHEVEALTEIFPAPIQAPFAHIIQPAADTTVQWGQLVTLAGEAFDPQDNGIEWNKFEWSNQDGLLGTGGELEISNLPIGENTITLKVTNSHSLSDETSIKVTVEDKLAQAGPTPAVGPESLSWHLDAIDTSINQEVSPIYKILKIYNLGSGELGEWSVENPVDWLKVGPPTAEKTTGIQVTVLPGLVETGEVLTTQLTLTFEGAEDKPVVVPVTVARGAIGPGFDAPDLPPGQNPTFGTNLFLPLIGR